MCHIRVQQTGGPLKENKEKATYTDHPGKGGILPYMMWQMGLLTANVISCLKPPGQILPRIVLLAVLFG